MGTPTKFWALVIPATEANGTEIVAAFEPIDEKTISPHLTAAIRIYPGLEDKLNTKSVDTPISLRRIDIDRPISIHCSSSDDSKKIRNYIKPGYEVMAEIQIRMNWKDVEKSTIKVKLREVIADKEKMYHPTDRNSYFEKRVSGVDYIQNGKYYQWNPTKNTWKKKRRY